MCTMSSYFKGFLSSTGCWKVFFNITGFLKITQNFETLRIAIGRRIAIKGNYGSMNRSVSTEDNRGLTPYTMELEKNASAIY